MVHEEETVVVLMDLNPTVFSSATQAWASKTQNGLRAREQRRHRVDGLSIAQPNLTRTTGYGWSRSSRAVATILSSWPDTQVT